MKECLDFMKFTRKKVFVVSGIALAVLILPIVLYAFLLSQFAVRHIWFPVVRAKTGYKIHAAECSVSLFGSQTCLFRNMKCTGNGLELAADKFSLEMDPFLLLDREARIEKLEIDGLTFKYEKKKQTSKKKSSRKKKSGSSAKKTAPGEPFRWSIRNFHLANSSFIYKDPSQFVRIGNLGIQAKNLLPGEHAEISMEGLLEISGKNRILQCPLKSSTDLKMPNEGSFPETLLFVCTSDKVLAAQLPGEQFSAKFLFHAQKKNSAIVIQEASFSLEKQNMLAAASAKGEIPHGNPSASPQWDKMSYSGNVKMRNFQIAPFADVFNGKKSGFSGEIRSADLDFSGIGVTPPVWKKNLKADLNAKTYDLSFPASLEKASPTVRMIVAPIHALVPVLELLNAGKKFPQLYELNVRISRVLSGRENMEMNKGSVRASVSNGILNVRKCLFEGGTLKKESVTGTVNLLNEKVKLEAEIDAEAFAAPAVIRGTLSNPKIDYKNTYRKLRKQQLEEILNSEKTDETIKKAGKLIDMFLK